MYLLDPAGIPKTNVLEYKDSCCLAITINMAIVKCRTFEFFRTSSPQTQQRFLTAFERQLGFQSETEYRSKHCSCDGETASVFFALLTSVWERLYIDSRIGGPSVLHNNSGGQFASNNEYLLVEKNKVRNTDIDDFARKCLKFGFFVASTFGIKNTYDVHPFGYTNVCDGKQHVMFPLKATQVISSVFHQNFNCSKYPEYLLPDLDEDGNIDADYVEFRNDLCPLMYGVDIGHEVTALSENTSLVPNGYGGRKYLREILRIKKIEMKDGLPYYAPEGKLIYIFTLFYVL